MVGFGQMDQSRCILWIKLNCSFQTSHLQEIKVSATLCTEILVTGRKGISWLAERLLALQGLCSMVSIIQLHMSA
jgi:hypothetical protein